ncbi:MAG TPA: Ig-like domain-containing protein, partial [Spirochaetales bacterium]|nr:Ig-like domain-containing protein [Spirochaetales bacterium]
MSIRVVHSGLATVRPARVSRLRCQAPGAWTATSQASHADSGTAGNQIRFRALATDASGRTFTVDRLVTADQQADRPVIKISNLSAFDGSVTLKMSNTVFGTVTDDDGPVTFAVSEDNSTWSPVTLDGNTWSYSTSAGDGAKTLYFKVTEAAPTSVVFATDTANEPRIQLGAGYHETFVSFRVDTEVPTFPETNPVMVDRTSPFDFADAVPMSSTMVFGGPTGQFALRILAKDANGVASVTATIPGTGGGSYTATANGPDVVQTTFTRFDTGTINVNGVPKVADGSVTIQIKAVDTSTLDATTTKTIIVDNSAPTLSFIAPLSGSAIKADTTISGNASDSGSGLASVTYRMGLNYADADGVGAGTAPEPDIALADPAQMNLWEIAFALGDTFYTDPLESYEDNSTGTPIYILPFIMKVTDNAGNVRERLPIQGSGATRPNGNSLTHASLMNITDIKAGQIIMVGTNVCIVSAYTAASGTVTWSGAAVDTAVTSYHWFEYALRVNPDGDKPTAAISYPSGEATVGGNIRIYGTAEDNQAVAEVWMQIDTNSDGSFTVADDAIGGWYAGDAGKKINGASSWNYTINQSQEFNPPIGETKTLLIRVRAVDINGKIGPWSLPTKIYVDSQVPIFGSAYELKLDPDTTPNNGNEIPYVYGMYIKGSWYLRGSVE